MSIEKLFEQHAEHDNQRFDSIEKQLEKGDARMASIDKKLDSLIASANKQKGFIAGVSAAFSLLISTVVGLIIYIWQRQFG